ncbi:MAG: 2-C-methyl-D-erythritol 4-phosphate cytidylyltransferase [Lachnospiraceae bacterium]|nr:2-C-methyl-D-erythritol 4-phosphate cytidylyltransferase [Lachnospiraceae bacterium]
MGKNIAVIFAGGVGTRMHTKDKPKQFLELYGKPIIVYTVETFQNCTAIDGLVVVCVEDWIPYMNELIYKYRLEKVRCVVPGGKTGQLSIFNGLRAAEKYYPDNDTIVLIHDGVRPLITQELILENIRITRDKGSCITCSAAKETFILVNGENVEVQDRSVSYFAKAPQTFYLPRILDAHRRSLENGYTNIIDSCTMMRMYDEKLSITLCGDDNIKVTTPDDYYIVKALMDARENLQLKKDRS